MLDKAQMAKAIVEALGSKGGAGKSPDELWEAVAEGIIESIKTTAVVTGTTPPNGGPLVSGKIQ